MNAIDAKVGIVVIGRNEGERLSRCLDSLRRAEISVVYVDSGSTDGSPMLAASRGVEVVRLEAPHTAAAARNAGLARLRGLCPALRLVQFLDGDCQLQAGWIERAAGCLWRDGSLAAVCGICRECDPGASIYSWICDIEWRMLPGPAQACGGNVMVRVEAIQAAGGFDATFIAGEDAELCCRLRRLGWRLLCVDQDMVVHDAAMRTLGQWLRRSVRVGHAYAQCSWKHGGPPLYWWLREMLSNWFWGLGVPMAVLVLSVVCGRYGLLPLVLYALLFARIYRRQRCAGVARRQAVLYAGCCVVRKFPQAVGQVCFHIRAVLSWPRLSIQHKAAPANPPCM